MAPEEAESTLVVGQERVVLRGDRCTIGKDASSGVVLDDPTVSRVHAVIERVGNAHVISDLGSRNGTTVSGTRLVGPRALRSGDEIRVGRVRLTYHSAAAVLGETQPVEPPPKVTARERDVLVELCRPLAEGSVFTEPATGSEIARALFISEAAVRMHLSRLYAKFNLDPTDPRVRAQIASAALDRGVVRVSDLVR